MEENIYNDQQLLVASIIGAIIGFVIGIIVFVFFVADQNSVCPSIDRRTSTPEINIHNCSESYRLEYYEDGSLRQVVCDNDSFLEEYLNKNL